MSKSGLLLYKGYTGTWEYDTFDKVYWGKVRGVNGLLIYEAPTYDQIIQQFHQLIDDEIENNWRE